MPYNRSRVSNTAVVVPTATETVVCTLIGISAPAGDYIDIDCNLYLLAGASPGTYTAKIERGVAAAGTQVGASVLQDFLANGHVVLGVQASDFFAGDVYNQQYVVTVTQASGASCTMTAGTMQQLY